MSSREASIGRSAKRKQEKIDQRRKEYEQQKLVEGIYCVLTRIDSAMSEKEEFTTDQQDNLISGLISEAYETSSLDTQSFSVNSIVEQSPSPSIYAIQNKQSPDDKLLFVSPMSSVNYTPVTDIRHKDLKRNSVQSENCLKYYVIDHEGCIFGSQTSSSKMVRLTGFFS
jgi:hypothetical protein